MAGTCFICEIDKFDIERKTDTGFDAHIKKDHYMWNYIFYIYNLENKDKTDYNGIESYVSKMLEDDDIGWFPIGRALSVDDEEDENISDKIQNRVKKIEEYLKTIDQFLDKQDDDF